MGKYDLMTLDDLKIELEVAEHTLREAYESFTRLREDYHELRGHADLLETILKKHGIGFPRFY